MTDKKKKILITGASSGIGKSIALKLLQEGCIIIGISRTHTIKRKNYIAYTQDISDLRGFSEVLDEIKKRHRKIYGIVSNASEGYFDKIENLSEKKIINYFNLNLLSHIILAKKMIPNLKRNKKGIFILMGSESSKVGGEQGTLYCTAKHALLGLTKSLKLEANKSSIRVTIINPGMVRTSFFDNLGFEPGNSKENAIQAKDIGELVYYIISASRYVNISDINIDPIKKVVKRKP
tara:strand:+ start:775 stop:1479 length:705 start_codon:yes stop_codon:yes gene_type:complete